jgi:hypothetical protein
MIKTARDSLRRAEQHFYIQDVISSRQCAHIINIEEVFYRDYCRLFFPDHTHDSWEPPELGSSFIADLLLF